MALNEKMTVNNKLERMLNKLYIPVFAETTKISVRMGGRRAENGPLKYDV
jgi:hypothetical protein